MASSSSEKSVGIIGCGTMGIGIAQVAAVAGHRVCVVDSNSDALVEAESKLNRILARQIEKQRMTQAEVAAIKDRIEYTVEIERIAADSAIVIEAIVENLEVKKSVFSRVENIVSADTVLATNTSSLSVTSIAASCDKSSRVIGVHFFNPAPLMPLVEIVPGLETSTSVASETRTLIDRWGKTTVLAKDTPGFIVNRVARPFYGESLRILEEGVADAATIDWALRDVAGFRMGPFELMDLIGNDINYAVTQTVFESFFYDPRYKPSFTQKRMVEAGRLGRKSGRGYYDYGETAEGSAAVEDSYLARQINDRVVAMLINEAVDAVFWDVASGQDIDLAMTKGVNYPKGLLEWCNEIGAETVLDRLRALHDEYGEDRYRPSPLLRRMASKGESFDV